MPFLCTLFPTLVGLILCCIIILKYATFPLCLWIACSAKPGAEQSQDYSKSALETTKPTLMCPLENNLDSPQKQEASVQGRPCHQCRTKSTSHCTGSSGTWGRKVETTSYNVLAEKWETMTHRTVLAGHTNQIFVMFRAVLRQYAVFSISVYTILSQTGSKNLNSWL